MAYTGILLILAALPVVFIMLFVYHKDKNKEPMNLLVKLFLSGILSCFVVLTISRILEPFLPFMTKTDTYLELVLYSFLGVAMIEELCKWMMTYLIGYHQRNFDELYDGIVYAIFVSLGFAFYENLVYVIKTSSVNTALLRAISAVPSHACDAIFMGYYLSVAKLYAFRKDKKNEKKNLILSIIIPIVLHGIYDFCLMTDNNIFITVFVAFISFLYVISIKRLKKLSNNNKRIKFKNKFCNRCGKVITEEICRNCGAKQI